MFVGASWSSSHVFQSQAYSTEFTMKTKITWEALAGFRWPTFVAKGNEMSVG